MKRILTTLAGVVLLAGTAAARQPGYETQSPDPARPAPAGQTLAAPTAAAEPQGKPARAKRSRPLFQVGLRGGINTVDHSFGGFRIGDTYFTPGSARAGFDAGLVVRFNLSRHLHIQSELNYAFVNYAVRANSYRLSSIVLRNERLEIPVELGFQFGWLRLFGGPVFRLHETQHSSSPRALTVRFNDDDIGIMGGVGLNIRKFFLDFRVSGYPRSYVWNDFTSQGTTRRIKISRNILYGGSIGFYF